jgi:YD repeat-containing protein
MYTYAHSYQGDIAAIVDSAGNLVVEYKYDAWGNITHIKE